VSESSASTVLVVASDPVVAALLGALVELERHTALYPGAGETLPSALSRLRPRVVLIEAVGDAPVAPDELGRLFASVRETGARGVLFAAAGRRDDLRRRAAALDAPWFTLPVDRRSLAHLLGLRSGESGAPVA
jgi:hypothetical protein